MLKSFAPVVVAGAAGTALAAYSYLSSDTGVAGTPGALLALVGAAAVTVGSLIATFAFLGRVLLALLGFLIGVGAVLTALAGYFLMQYGLAIVMALTFVGLLVAVFTPATQRRQIR